MKRNVGKTDRVIRIVLGLVIIVLGYLNNSWWGAIGLIPLLTAFVGFCPLYVPFKINTEKSAAE
ncbi:MAG: DUF2892 domain-containing protein [Calditrichaeota bacterium]|nr:DUF2892 domain-containing protein [Calditrichota bacterium]